MLVVLVGALLICGPVQAVVVLKKGATEPLLGYLVRQDETAIVIRTIQDDGKPKEQSIRRADIDELLITVAPERLAALNPAQPQLYREYAEELAEKARDPEARDAAVRLFHIAAYHGNDKLRKSALLGLAAMATSAAHVRRLRAAAYLYDPEHSPALIQPPTAVPAPRTPADRQATSELLHAVRAIRQGRASETRRILDSPTIGEPLALLSKIITREQLLALAISRPPSDASLRQLLAAEIALEQALTDAPAAPPAEESTATWSAAAAGGLAPLPPLDLLHLTPFDPRASVFRNGKWVAP